MSTGQVVPLRRSRGTEPSAAPDPPSTAEVETLGLGQRLKAARRRRRISVARAAAETKIRADFLKKMEADDFRFLPAGYVRAFLGTYARYLRLDPRSVLQEFDRDHSSGGTDVSLIASVGHTDLRGHRLHVRAVAIAAAFIIVLLAVLGNGTAPDRTPRARDRRAPASDADRGVQPAPLLDPALDDPVDTGVSRPLRLRVIAVDGDCWVAVTTDGEPLYTTPGRGLLRGDAIGPFRATETMTVRLGNAAAVDIVVNGRRYSDLGAEGEVVELRLPNDLGRAHLRTTSTTT